MNPILRLLPLFLLLVALSTGCAGPRVTLRAPAADPAAARTDLFSHEPFDRVLRATVDPVTHEVDFAAMRAGHLDAIDGYLAAAAVAQPERWSAVDQKAFWINVHNAAALRQIATHWPLKSLNDLRGPMGPWPLETRYRVAGQWRSLAAMQATTFESFGDPRVAFALNWGARGCAPLPNRAYSPERLETDLSAATEDFLAGAFEWDASAKPSRVKIAGLVGLFAPRMAKGHPSLLAGLSALRPIPAELLDSSVEFVPFDWRVVSPSPAPAPPKPAEE